jgi:hypothetical protein
LASIRFSEVGALGESWTPQLRGSTPRLEQGPSLNPVRYPAVTGLAGAIGAAEGAPISFHAVTDHPAAAVFAGRREGMDCALEAVEGMRITSGHPDLESPVVLVAANLAPSHLLQSLTITHFVACLLSYPLSGRSNPPLFTRVRGREILRSLLTGRQAWSGRLSAGASPCAWFVTPAGFPGMQAGPPGGYRAPVGLVVRAEAAG